MSDDLAQAQADCAAIRAVLDFHLPAGWRQTDQDCLLLAYVVRLAHHAPKEITHGSIHRRLAAVMRPVLDDLPAILAEIECEGARAQKAGEATQWDEHSPVPILLRRALAAMRQIEKLADQRKSAGAWREWPLRIRVVLDGIQHDGGPLSFATKDKYAGAGVLIIQDLLVLAGYGRIEARTISTVV